MFINNTYNIHVACVSISIQSLIEEKKVNSQCLSFYEVTKSSLYLVLTERPIYYWQYTVKWSMMTLLLSLHKSGSVNPEWDNSHYVWWQGQECDFLFNLCINDIACDIQMFPRTEGIHYLTISRSFLHIVLSEFLLKWSFYNYTHEIVLYFMHVLHMFLSENINYIVYIYVTNTFYYSLIIPRGLYCNKHRASYI